MINSAVSLAVGNLGKGMNRPALENLSTTTMMVVLPWDGGSPVIKSTERWDQGLQGIERGWSKPWGERWETFPWLHVGEAVTKLLVSSLMVGHQNRLWRNSRVRIVPGWQVRREEWPHWRTWERTDLGTNKQLVGPPPGSGSWTLACLIVFSSSHCTGATILELVIMGVIGSSWLLFAYTRDRASGLRCFVPGRNDKINWNLLKNRDQHAWRGLSRFACWIYSRFLWSVSTWNWCLAPSS